MAGAGDQWRYKTSAPTWTSAAAGDNLHLPVQLSPERGPFDGDFYRVLREQHAQWEPQGGRWPVTWGPTPIRCCSPGT